MKWTNFSVGLCDLVYRPLASHGADPFHFDRKPIHSPIVEVIQKELR